MVLEIVICLILNFCFNPATWLIAATGPKVANFFGIFLSIDRRLITKFRILGFLAEFLIVANGALGKHVLSQGIPEILMGSDAKNVALGKFVDKIFLVVKVICEAHQTA